MVSLRREKPRCCTILFAFTFWAVWQLIVTVTFLLVWVVQQTVVLLPRCCGGAVLTFVLRITAPLMSVLTCSFVTTNTCEPCYGAEVGQIESFDDFLQRLSASRRKNIRRNLKKADEELQRHGIQVSYHVAGTWRLTAEHRGVIWEQCKRHDARGYGYSDILNCGKPVPPRIMYMGEIVLILAFPCDIQVFRDRNGAMVSLNTQVRIGSTLWNPNYATVEEYSRVGIYPVSSRYQLKEAIRLRLRILNVMPSMRSAKGALGLRPLRRCSIFCAVWRCGCRREPRPEVTESPVVDEEPRQPQGGKRAARKKAAAVAASAGSGATSDGPRTESTRSSDATALTTFGPSTEVDPDMQQEAKPNHVEITVQAQNGAKGNGVSHPAPKGGKKAARKKAAAAAAAAIAASEESHGGRPCEPEHVESFELEHGSVPPTT